MSSFPFDYGLDYMNSSAWTGADVRIIWVTEASDLYTAQAAQRAKQFVGSITTLGEFVGTGYPASFGARWSIGTEVTTLDTTDHDRKFTTSSGVLNKSGVGPATNSYGLVTGFVFYDHTTNDNDSPLIGFHDLFAAGESFTPNGGAVNTTWDAEGIGKIVATAS